MTTALGQFSDIAAKRFSIPRTHASKAILNCLVFERGTRSYGLRLNSAGFDAYLDLEGKTVDEILKRVPTTRRNLDRVLYYFAGAGVRLTNV